MVNKNPLISIVMPIYNAEAYLDTALKSIEAQKYYDYEVIMVNDCSEDRSSNICKDWAEKDTRFKVVELMQNGGAGKARNIGIDYACGDYLAFMDADDVIPDNTYDDAVESLRKYPAEQVVWGLTEVYSNEKEEVVRNNPIIPQECYCRSPEEVLRQAVILEEKTLFGYQWNRLYKMELIKSNHIRFEDSELYEDYFFNLSVIEKVNSLNVLATSGYFYNKRENQSLTNKFVKDYFKLSYRRVNGMLSICRDKGIYTDMTGNILGNIYLRYVLSALMRNCDKRSELTLAQRRNWVKKVSHTKLYREIVENQKINSKMLRMLKILMNNQAILGCLMMGRLMYLIKKTTPMIFALGKMKRD